MGKFIQASVIALTLTITGSAFAATADTIVKSTSVNQDSPAPGQVLPIRTAKVRFVINKLTISQTPNGYKWDWTVACDQRFDAPVFDLRNLKDYWFGIGAHASCSVLLNSKVSEVVSNSYIIINEDEAFGKGTGQIDRKSFSANMFINRDRNSTTSKASDHVNTASWSRDLNAKTMGLELTEARDNVCVNGVCNVVAGDYLSAVVEIED